MTIRYPAEIDDSLNIPRAVDLVTTNAADSVNILRDAIISTESTLGVNPATTYVTVRNRLDQLENALNALSEIEIGDGVFIANGDLSGTSTSQAVIALRGYPLANTAPTNGQVLTWNGTSSNWVPASGLYKENETEYAVQVSGDQINISLNDQIQTGLENGLITSILREITTTDDTPTSAYTWSLNDNAITSVDIIVTAISAGALAGAAYKRSSVFRVIDGSISQVGVSHDTQTDEDAEAWNAQITYDEYGNGNVILTGESLTTISWCCAVRIQSTYASATVSTPTPSITGFSPNQGNDTGGTPITVYLEDTSGVTGVEINGIPITGFQIVNSTTITGFTPPGAAYTYGTVSAVNSHGTGYGDAYLYRPLTIYLVSPNYSGSGGGESVTVIVSDSSNIVSVTLDGEPLQGLTVLDPNSLYGASPPHANGTVDVTVTNTSTSVTLTNGFTYTPLQVQAITPTAGSLEGGTLVSIQVNNATNVTGATVGGVPLTDLNVLPGEDAVEGITGSHVAGVVDVYVTNQGETSPYPLIGGFTYTSPPPVLNPACQADTKPASEIDITSLTGPGTLLEVPVTLSESSPLATVSFNPGETRYAQYLYFTITEADTYSIALGPGFLPSGLFNAWVILKGGPCSTSTILYSSFGGSYYAAQITNVFLSPGTYSVECTTIYQLITGTMVCVIARPF